MDEELQMFIDDANENMQNTIDFLNRELIKIRAGKASPNMLDGVFVDYYGTNTPLSRVANVGISDARTLVIQPWEKTMIAPIEKAIQQANLGFNPDNNGDIIRINVPVLTEERRRNLVKQVKNEGESAKIGIRKARKDTNDELKKLKKDGFSEDAIKSGEDEVQDLTNKFIVIIDNLIDEKEKEIMTV